MAPGALCGKTLRVTAEVLSLMQRSAVHCDWAPEALLAWIWPPIMHGQCLLFRDQQGSAVAYASWAFVSDDAHQALKTSARALTLEEWNSGTNIWVIDLIAPYGHVRQVVRRMKQEACRHGLAGKAVHWTRRYVRRRDGG